MMRSFLRHPADEHGDALGRIYDLYLEICPRDERGNLVTYKPGLYRTDEIMGEKLAEYLRQYYHDVPPPGTEDKDKIIQHIHSIINYVEGEGSPEHNSPTWATTWNSIDQDVLLTHLTYWHMRKQIVLEKRLNRDLLSQSRSQDAETDSNLPIPEDLETSKRWLQSMEENDRRGLLPISLTGYEPKDPVSGSFNPQGRPKVYSSFIGQDTPDTLTYPYPEQHLQFGERVPDSNPILSRTYTAGGKKQKRKYRKNNRRSKLNSKRLSKRRSKRRSNRSSKRL